MNPRLVCLACAFFFLVSSLNCNNNEGPVAPDGPLGPVVAFSHSAPTGYIIGEEITFDASATTDAFFTITGYTWSFDDAPGPFTTDTPLISHEFHTAGTYSVKLTVSDNSDFSDTVSHEIEIFPPGSLPLACFNYSAPDGWQPEKDLVFDASCSSDPDGDSLSFTWDFGDGSTEGPFPDPLIDHAFPYESDFAVTLTATDSRGRLNVSDPLSISIGTVKPPPIISNLDYSDDSYEVDIVLQGDYAYIADQFYTLKIVDISDPANPFVTAVLDNVPQGQLGNDPEPTMIEVHGDFAYLELKDSMFLIADVSDPYNPVMLSHIPIDSDWDFKFTVVGDFAFIGPGKNNQNVTLQVFDIADRSTPVLITDFLVDPTQNIMVKNMVIRDGFAYVSVGGGLRSRKLYTIDVYDPWNPVILNFLHDLNINHPVSMITHGDFLYLADNSILHVFNLLDPAKPVFENYVITSTYQPLLHACDDKLYLARRNLYVYSLLDPSLPVFEKEIFLPDGNVTSVGVSAGLAYITEDSGELSIVDLSTDDGPSYVCGLENLRSGLMAMSGDYLYAAGSHELNVVDISTPDIPALVNTITLPDSCWKMRLHGDSLWIIGQYGDGVFRFDISNPALPVLISVNEMDFSVFDFMFDDDYVYLDSGTDLYIYSADGFPGQPPLSRLPLEGPRAFSLYDGYAFVSTESDKLQIVDISDPLNPILVNSLDFDGYIIETRFSNGYAYLNRYSNTSYGDLIILDITSPANPAILSSLELGWRTRHMDVLGDYAYCSAESGFYICDVSDPYNPFRLNAVTDSVCSLESILVSGRYAFSGSDNMSVLRVFKLW